LPNGWVRRTAAVSLLRTVSPSAAAVDGSTWIVPFVATMSADWREVPKFGGSSTVNGWSGAPP
jgi:hypothetical protein